MNPPVRIILTREQEQCRAWRRALEAAGVEVLCLPLIRFTPLDPPPDFASDTYDWILFRSPKAVRSFFDGGHDTGGAKLGVLGKGTAAALQACGRASDLDGFYSTGSEMAAAFAATIAPPARILLPGPAEPLEDPRRTLVAAGFEIHEVPFYRTDAVPAADLPADPWREGDLIFFASPSAVRAYTAAWDVATPCVAIGETTAVAAREAGFTVAVAAEPTLDAMIRAAGLDPRPSPQPTESSS